MGSHIDGSESVLESMPVSISVASSPHKPRLDGTMDDGGENESEIFTHFDLHIICGGAKFREKSRATSLPIPMHSPFDSFPPRTDNFERRNK